LLSNSKLLKDKFWAKENNWIFTNYGLISSQYLSNYVQWFVKIELESKTVSILAHFLCQCKYFFVDFSTFFDFFAIFLAFWGAKGLNEYYFSL